jgi:hypothetical protein
MEEDRYSEARKSPPRQSCRGGLLSVISIQPRAACSTSGELDLSRDVDVFGARIAALGVCGVGVLSRDRSK